MDALVSYLQVMGTQPSSKGATTMDVNTMRIVATLAAFVTFLGIVAWALAGRNKARFEEAAQLPFEQD
jgi:cytochrome c oxidase cbb3-type subunit 4